MNILAFRQGGAEYFWWEREKQQQSASRFLDDQWPLFCMILTVVGRCLYCDGCDSHSDDT
jgi:hypothetical protein